MISVGISGFCSDSEEIRNGFCKLNKNATLNTHITLKKTFSRGLNARHLLNDAVYMSFEICVVGNMKTTTCVLTAVLHFVDTMLSPIFFLRFLGPFFL